MSDNSSKTHSVKIVEARSWLAQSVGLLGASEPYPLLLHTRFGIHTFGMKFPIDILILDGEKRIVRLFENVVPNRVCVWNPIYSHVLELSFGTINRNHMKQGDRIQIEIIKKT